MKHQLPGEKKLQIQPFPGKQWIYFVMMVGIDELSEMTLSHGMDQQKAREQQTATKARLIPDTAVQS